ncbi:unnamed protein product [Nesidiocoris tenuis]|uniref:Uncharacterized protein n=1 Tax=Nesidiocoris tenuis TaxID=355587 RepID=A0A6H5GFF3_9HEMI|nr:unnamed protein product [Nesidiocoris tenuis]
MLWPPANLVKKTKRTKRLNPLELRPPVAASLMDSRAVSTGDNRCDVITRTSSGCHVFYLYGWMNFVKRITARRCSVPILDFRTITILPFTLIIKSYK